MGGRAFFAAILFLVSLIVFAYGVGVGRYGWFPYNLIQEIRNEAKFLLSDLRGGAKRFQADAFEGHFEDYERIKSASGVSETNLIVRRAAGGVGYLAVYGTFSLNGVPAHAALLIDRKDWKVVHEWRVGEEHIKGARRPGNKFPHGFEILKDGSILAAFDGGKSLQRIDACGQRQWTTEGGFHHSISLLENEARAWTLAHRLDGLASDSSPLKYSDLVEINVETGAILRRISYSQIWEANPNLDVLGIRSDDEGKGQPRWINDPFHANDVEPLSQRLADKYPGFQALDLLVSFRAPNLFFVLDPDSLRIKWWRAGATRKQHDPDWGGLGKISVLDNNMHREHSRIISIDPVTYDVDVLVQGASMDFYTWRRGKHQILPGGNALVTSPEQGRIFEVEVGGGQGNLVFDLHSMGGKTGRGRLLVSQAVWLPNGYFKGNGGNLCANLSIEVAIYMVFGSILSTSR